MVGRVATILLVSAAALLSVAAETPEEKRQAMLDAIDKVLSGMAYAGAGLCLFAIVWAGFVLMAEGAEGDVRRGKARNAVVMAVVGLVVVLLAKAIAAVISGPLNPILPGA